jgi:hypothetical protein
MKTIRTFPMFVPAAACFVMCEHASTVPRDMYILNDCSLCLGISQGLTTVSGGKGAADKVKKYTYRELQELVANVCMFLKHIHGFTIVTPSPTYVHTLCENL